LSTLTGTVVNAQTKAPAVEVLVTATSPSLQGEQTAVTDAQGNYQIPDLPPGTYTLRFENESYQPYARHHIDLRIDSTTRVNVELLPTGFASGPDHS
jgi:hypothetical protein